MRIVIKISSSLIRRKMLSKCQVQSSRKFSIWQTMPTNNHLLRSNTTLKELNNSLSIMSLRSPTSQLKGRMSINCNSLKLMLSAKSPMKSKQSQNYKLQKAHHKICKIKKLLNQWESSRAKMSMIQQQTSRGIQSISRIQNTSKKSSLFPSQQFLRKGTTVMPKIKMKRHLENLQSCSTKNQINCLTRGRNKLRIVSPLSAREYCKHQ